jgi:hypothetical protein
MTRAYPRESPIRVAIGMENNGRIILRATDPDGLEMPFEANASEGGVLSEEQLAQGAAKVQAMRRG